MGKRSKAPPAPDYTPIAAANREAAEISAATSREQLAWAREQFASNKDLLERVLAVQLPAMESEAAAGQQLRERYNQVFQPIEDALIKEVEEYNTPARADFDAGRAIATVGQAFDAARTNAQARMESFGIDPSQTRASALDAGIRVQEAAAKAAAGTQSHLNTENTGRALRSEAINLGKGLPANIAGAYGTAMAAGNQGFGNAMNLTQSGANSMGTGLQWAGNQNTALNNWSNTLNRQQEGQMTAWNARQQQSRSTGSALGSVAGMALGAYTGGAFTGLGGMLGFDDGGRVPDDPRDPEGKLDTVDAKLSGGEHVIPASAVRRLGSDHFDKLIAKYGDEEDRKAALHRLHTGRPGGEPVRRHALAA